MALYELYDDLTARLRTSGDYVWPLVLRLIMFWEFWESGIEKLRGKNWFADIPWADWQIGFPFPFSAISANVNWFLATWGELVLAVLVLLGLFTRFAAFSLMILTVVAMVAVHWPAEWGSLAELWKGYAITAKGFGNFKLPLLFILILLPLIFYGGGKLSLDHLLLKFTARGDETVQRIGDIQAAGLAFLVLGVATIYPMLVLGIVFLVLAAVCLIGAKLLYG